MNNSKQACTTESNRPNGGATALRPQRRLYEHGRQSHINYTPSVILKDAKQRYWAQSQRWRGPTNQHWASGTVAYREHQLWRHLHRYAPTFSHGTVRQHIIVFKHKKNVHYTHTITLIAVFFDQLPRLPVKLRHCHLGSDANVSLHTHTRTHARACIGILLHISCE